MLWSSSKFWEVMRSRVRGTSQAKCDWTLSVTAQIQNVRPVDGNRLVYMEVKQISLYPKHRRPS